MFVELLSIFGIVTGFILVVLAIASGLYYLSELVEENTEFTRRFLSRSINSIVVLLILLWIVDGFPFKLTLFSLATYYVYHLNMKTFPYINLTGPIFVSSCILVMLNHYLWFRYFSNPYIPSIEERLSPGYKPPHICSFPEVASFFGVCVWFVPFALFISLSANENTLPSNMQDLNRFGEGEGNKDDSESPRAKGVGLVKIVIGLVKERVTLVFRMLGYELDPTHGRII
ncbi:unnamed protein product [Kuraishia capsulata CBS 1993]|uniref:Protein SVP26 n=1 Tax=Kuraishia capsulata CBS 1993 TaxID=1382522 RepID=W6MKL3_9ASCO|nr:uncharacterized protein KUCA_T00001239001 [Kuraishia capsulata CBS 1993]CDK25272.1 unnamed protein product [Kuraishia capsulata CBS 1993]